MNGVDVSRFFSLRTLIFCLALGWVALPGCSGSKIPTGTVSGKVVLNDQPYSNADVIFLSMESGKAATGALATDGTFSLSEPLPVGSYRVYLAPKLEGAGEEPQMVKIDEGVNEKYWNESTTDISKEVKAGSNEVTIELSR